MAAVTDVISMSVGQAKFNAKKVNGLGSIAMWAWNKVSTTQEGLLLTAKPGAVVAIALIANVTVKEAVVQPVMQGIVSRTLDGLPASFTVAGLQVAGSGPGLRGVERVTFRTPRSAATGSAAARTSPPRARSAAGSAMA